MKIIWFVFGFGLAGGVSAEEKSTRFLDVFAPLRTEMAALSPDGKRLAYSVREGGQISILSLEVGTPQQATSVVTVAEDKYAPGYMQRDDGNSPSRIEWLRWATAERLVVQSNMIFLSKDRNLRGAIFGFDYDGKNARMIYSAADALGRIEVLGLVPGKTSELLVFEPFPRGQEWVAVDAFTGDNRKLSGSAYREIWTAIQNREVRETQRRQKQFATLATLFPRRQLTWFEHHGESSRFLVQWQSVAEPGAFVVVDPDSAKAWEFVRRESASTAAKLHRSEDFDLVDGTGRRYTGTLVIPNSPRVKKAPLVLWMPEIFGERVRGVYRPEVQALAEMGFAVATVDGRQVSVESTPAAVQLADWVVLPKHKDDRLRIRPRDFLAPSIDVPGEVAHQLQALDLLADHFPVSRTAVALFGQGSAGSQALIAAVEAPGRFRCVVSINPMPENRMDSSHGYPAFDAAMAKLKTTPVESVLILVSRIGSGTKILPSLQPARFAWGDLKKKGTNAEWVFIPREFGARQPAARAAVFRDIEAFLNKHLISYSVKIGEMTELESFPDAEVSPKK